MYSIFFCLVQIPCRNELSCESLAIMQFGELVTLARAIFTIRTLKSNRMSQLYEWYSPICTYLSIFYNTIFCHQEF